jgi:hypothetical protein
MNQRHADAIYRLSRRRFNARHREGPTMLSSWKDGPRHNPPHAPALWDEGTLLALNPVELGQRAESRRQAGDNLTAGWLDDMRQAPAGNRHRIAGIIAQRMAELGDGPRP